MIRTLTRLIRNHMADFREFGRVGFEIQALQTKGGIQDHKIFYLNEEQATLLMTYLKNTEQVRAFKKELVRQFFLMREELQNVKAVKAERKAIRTEMTDAIKALPDSPHKRFKYAQYTDLAYRVALGKSARQLRKERGADKRATASDYMTSDELAAVSRMENRISVLIEIGMNYKQVKASLIRVQFMPQSGQNAV